MTNLFTLSKSNRFKEKKDKNVIDFINDNDINELKNFFKTNIPDDIFTALNDQYINTNHELCYPLHEAVRMGNIEIITLLIDHKADIESKASDSYTPLITACSDKSSGDVKIVNLLINNKADIKISKILII